MDKQGTKWFDGLKAYARRCRSKRPLVDRGALSTAEEMQCRIIGGSLIAWLREHGPHFLQERAVLAALQKWEKDPFVIFTSDQPGLVAANEILKDSPPAIAFLYPDEFTRWLKTHPDADYRCHVHMWSLFVPLDTETLERAKKHPLASGECYWLHKEGTSGGRLFGRGGDHLWKWNGEEAELLEECFDQWVS